jgi:SPOR domain
VVVSALANSLAVQRVIADSVEPVTLEAESASAGGCGSSDFRISDRSASESPCQRHAQESTETARGRAYLVATASPGYTMIRQGSERAIGRLHPEFVNRLAAAVAEARGSGLPFAGIFSAYRPPAFGVGGFIDKFHSLHTYGLAVDITGIGAPGTPSALLWHEIAARHGVICPYGPHNPVEWNHCQPTQVKIIQPENPLRETVTAEGPTSLEDMFEVGYSLIAVPGSVSETAPDPPPHLFKRRQGIAIPVERRINTSIIAPPKSSASWAVLLVGDRSESNALAAYNLISKKHPTILGAYQPVIVHTSLGLNTRTNWHRVRIEANSRAAVEALCSKLRAAGERCLVQRT